MFFLLQGKEIIHKCHLEFYVARVYLKFYAEEILLKDVHVKNV